jgi:hypothetical protein
LLRKSNGGKKIGRHVDKRRIGGLLARYAAFVRKLCNRKTDFTAENAESAEKRQRKDNKKSLWFFVFSSGLLFFSSLRSLRSLR